MKSESQRQREATIFDAARQLTSPEERAAYLDLACKGDAALRQRIEQLLAEAAEADAFFEDNDCPGNDLQNGTGEIELPKDEGLGTQIGPYKLLEKLGEGGFGIVYMAEQEEPVRRKVALKIIKMGMDTKEVVARFEAERQALCMMEHPNIARVLDAGATETGRPYFVMELVRGYRITEFCDTNRLSTNQRLELFIQVCQAVQHAHQKGIIHRDLKPSNVMITLHDGKPVPKVIDFGIAKATQMRLTEKTLFTRYDQFLGTPAYTSPEQAEMSGLDVDTRSDIYSLGVLLYELLTGTTPFEEETLRKAALEEVRRIIRETDPPKPSTRLESLGARLTEVAQRRQIDPGTITRLVRGDLDWIVMKALEKDRTRRFETANGLAQDIRRHLEHQPVAAGPPTPFYRFRKFARRRRGLLVSGVTVGATLIVATIVSLWQAGEARRQQREAVANLGLAEQAQEQAETASLELRDSLVRADLSTANRLFESGQSRKALAHLARALRNDPEYWPAAMRLLSALTERGFAVDRIPPLEHDTFVRGAWLNSEQDLVLTYAGRGLATWEAQTGKLVARLQTQTSLIPVRILPDSSRLIVQGKQGGAWLWDEQSGRLVHEICPSNHYLRSALTISPAHDERWFAWLDAGGALQTARFVRGEPQTAVELPQASGLEELIADRNGRYLAGAKDRGGYRIWDLAKQEFLGEVPSSETGRPGFSARMDGDSFAFWEESERTFHHVNLSDPALAQLRLSAADLVPSEHVNVEFAEPLEFRVSQDNHQLTVFRFDRSRSRLWASTWDLKTHQCLARWEDTSGIDGQPIVMAQQGGLVATAAERGHELRVRNVETGKATATFPRQEQEITAILFSPEGGRVAIETADHSDQIWDVLTGNSLTPPMKHDEDLWQWHFSREGEIFMTASSDKQLRMWNSRTGELLSEPLVFSSFATPMGRSLDGHRILLYMSLLSQGPDSGVYETMDGRGVLISGMPRRAFPGQFQARPKFSRGSGRYVYFAQSGTEVRGFVEEPSSLLGWRSSATYYEWDLIGGDVCHKASIPGSPRKYIIPRREPAQFAAVEGEDAIHVCRLATGDRLTTIKTSSPIKRIFISDNGSALVSLGYDQQCYLWDARTGALVAKIKFRSDEDHDVLPILSEDGSRLALVARGEGWIRLWDARTGQPAAKEIPLHKSDPFALSPKGRFVAVPAAGDLAQVFDAANGDLVAEFPHEAPISRLAFDREGGRLLTSGADHPNERCYVKVWDIRKNKMVGEPMAFTKHVRAVSFLNTHGLVVAATIEPNSVLKIWDPETGEVVVEPQALSMGGLILGSAGRGLLQLDGTEVFLDAAWTSATNLIFRQLPHCPVPAPDWLPLLAEAIAGLRLDAQGGSQSVDPSALAALEDRIKGLETEDDYTRCAQWLLTDPASRPLNPYTDRTWADHVAILLNQEESSVEDLQEVLLIDPDNALTTARLGLYHAEARARQAADGNMGNLPSPRRWLSPAMYYSNQATNLAPDSAEVWWMRSEVLLLEGKTEQARQAIEHALQLDDGLPDAWFTLALIREKQGERDAAYQAFRRSLIRTWEVPAETQLLHKPLRELGKLKYAGGGTLSKKARDWAVGDQPILHKIAPEWLVRYAVSQATEDAGGMGCLVFAMLELKQLNEAEEILKRALTTYPKTEWLWRLKGRLARKLDDLAGAAESFVRAAQLADEAQNDGSRKWTFELLAPVYDLLEKHVEAREARLQAALLKRPTEATTWQIDLSPHYNAKFNETRWHSQYQKDRLRGLPQGLCRLPGTGGTQFDLRGIVQLASQATPVLREEYPSRIDGILVRKRLDRFQILHAAGTAGEAWAPAGIKVARMEVHYRSGRESEVITFVNERNTAGWARVLDDKDPLLARVAWERDLVRGRSLAKIYCTTWDNPFPEDEITHVDYISEMNIPAHFILAITAESDAWLQMEERLRAAGQKAQEGDWRTAGKLAAEVVEDPVLDLEDFEQMQGRVALRLAIMLAKGNQPEAYEKLCRQVMNSKPDSLDPTAAATLACALSLRSLADGAFTDRALELARRAHAAQGSDRRAKGDLALALALTRKGQFQEALVDALQATQDWYSSQRLRASAAAGCAAMAHLRLGDPRKAALYLALGSHLLNFPLTYYEAQDREWSEKVLAEVLVEEARRSLGRLAESGEAAFTELAEIRQRGHQAYRQSHWSEAAEAYARLLHHPDFDPLLELALSIHLTKENMCTAFILAEQFEDLRDMAEKFLGIPAAHMANAAVMESVANAVLRGGNRVDPELREKAMKLNGEALNSHPENLYICHTQAQGLLAQGAWKEAYNYCRQSLEMESVNHRGSALAMQAIALCGMGNQSGAREALKGARSILADALNNLKPYEYPPAHIQIWIQFAEEALAKKTAQPNGSPANGTAARN